MFRAGFAHQGAKEKQLLKQGNAFNVNPFVLRAMMSGQYWPEGDEVYHAELTVPILLVHGMYDKFVPIDEDQRMAEVRRHTFMNTNPCLLSKEALLPIYKIYIISIQFEVVMKLNYDMNYEQSLYQAHHIQ